MHQLQLVPLLKPRCFHLWWGLAGTSEVAVETVAAAAAAAAADTAAGPGVVFVDLEILLDEVVPFLLPFWWESPTAIL